jgi:hypothetical protein
MVSGLAITYRPLPLSAYRLIARPDTRLHHDAVIDPIEDETMQMNIQICNGPKTLDQNATV